MGWPYDDEQLGLHKVAEYYYRLVGTRPFYPTSIKPNGTNFPKISGDLHRGRQSRRSEYAGSI